MRIACTEAWGALWLYTTQMMGFSKIDISNDTLMSTQEMLISSMRELQSREKTLHQKIKDSTLAARDSMKKSDRCSARGHIMRGKRFSVQLKTVENMILSLEAQQDALDNSVLSSVLFSTFKGASEAFASWQQQSGSMLDTAQVDTVKQDFEDSIRQANEISSAIALPLAPLMEDDLSTTEELDNILEELEGYAVSIFPSLPTTELIATEERENHTTKPVPMMA